MKRQWKWDRPIFYPPSQPALNYMGESVQLYIDTEAEAVFRTINEISEKGGELFMTMETRLMEKGRVEGRVEGHGKRQG